MLLTRSRLGHGGCQLLTGSRQLCRGDRHLRQLGGWSWLLLLLLLRGAGELSGCRWLIACRLRLSGSRCPRVACRLDGCCTRCSCLLSRLRLFSIHLHPLCLHPQQMGQLWIAICSKIGLVGRFRRVLGACWAEEWLWGLLRGSEVWRQRTACLGSWSFQPSDDAAVGMVRTWQEFFSERESKERRKGNCCRARSYGASEIFWHGAC